MKYAVISDIHGNLEALNAVMTDIDSIGVDAIICLGDIVGYYSEPEKCVEIVMERVAYSVAGNHDYAAIGKINTQNFTYYAFEAIEWTKKQLSQKSLDFLNSLPLSIQMDGVVFTHSSPNNPEHFTYIFPNSSNAILAAFESMVSNVVFVGHTHWPFIMVQKEPGVIKQLQEQEADLDKDCYYLINTGSVGQPRNRDTRASYGVIDTNAMKVYLRKVEYDFTATQRKELENGLPMFLAERLANGR